MSSSHTQRPAGSTPRAHDPFLDERGDQDQFLHEHAPPTDETPTIISKKAPSTPGTPTGSEDFSSQLSGRMLAHFELIEAIGVGGMAAVLRARDTQLDRIVALKILPPDMAKEPENVRRFHQEARAAARLDHENIARVFFCGEDQRLNFIAFEYVDGENLRNIIEKRGRLPVGEAVHYMLQVATGLAHASSRDVVHRDIKPSNIIITRNGRAKLVDMGLARNSSLPRSQELTHSGVTLGTFDYISPEQALEPRDADVRSDIYSLGCTFYHVLTGQAPVPEGTAAKKLHHHQHVLPLDPRVLNPDVPDSVAAILAKMMAKNVKDRYQRPEHLVQHLMQVAQQLGAGSTLPEGVLFVDAPLPNPPRLHPLLLGAMALGGLVALLVLLSMVPSEEPVPPKPRVHLTTTGQTPPAPQGNTNKQPPKQEQPPLAPRESPRDSLRVKTEEELRTALEQGGERMTIKIDGSLQVLHGQLPFKPAPGGKRRTIKIESSEPGSPAELSLRYDAQPPDGADWAGLVVEDCEVSFHNIRFQLRTPVTPQKTVAGVRIGRAAGVRFHRCAFSQEWTPEPLLGKPDLIPAASILVSSLGVAMQERPQVRLDECLFQGDGQAAIAIQGPASILPTSCAFGPHATLFHVRGDAKGYDTELHLDHCAAFVALGPVLRIDQQARCWLNVQRSLFSNPELGPALRERDPLHLIHQTSVREPQVVFNEPERNAYHNLQALWVVPTPTTAAIRFDSILAANWADMQERVALQPAGKLHPGSRVLEPGKQFYPWQEPRPLEWLNKQAKLAFRINPAMPELRLPTGKPLGTTAGVWGSTYEDGELPILKEVAAASQDKIVDPQSTGELPGIYATLAAALSAAGKDGGVVLIKHNGELPMQPLTLPAAPTIVVRAYPGYTPTLTLGKTSAEHAALFALQGGKLQLERLTFKLHRDRGAAGSILSLLAVHGEGHCTFQDCVVQLMHGRASLDDTPQARVLTLLEAPNGTPPVGAKEPRVKVAFHNSYVYGQGDLCRTLATQTCGLELHNTLVALEGTLVRLQGATEEQSPTGLVSLKMDESTTYLTEHMLHLLDAQNGKGLCAVSIVSRRNLLLSGATPGAMMPGVGRKALVFIEGPENRMRVEKLLSWEGEGNAYSGYGNKFLDLRTNDTMMPKVGMDSFDWPTFTREQDPEPKFLSLKFAFETTGKALDTLTPEDFLTEREALAGYGANLAALQKKLFAAVPVLRPSVSEDQSLLSPSQAPRAEVHDGSTARDHSGP